MNTCLGALRKKRTREARELDEETAHSPETTGRDADPEEEALGSERRSEMWAALRHVRAEHGAALVVRRGQLTEEPWPDFEGRRPPWQCPRFLHPSWFFVR